MRRIKVEHELPEMPVPPAPHASWAMIGLFLLAGIAALRLGSSLLLPILISGFLALLVAPAVSWLVVRRIPSAIASGLVVFSLVSAVGVSGYVLVNPAADWVATAPETLAQAERKIRRVTSSLQTLQKTAEQVEKVTSATGAPTDGKPAVTVAPAGLFERLSGTTFSFMGAMLTVVFLTYFLLAMGGRFREKMADLLPATYRKQVNAALVDMQTAMSAYLLASTIISFGVGLLTFGLLWLLDVPNPLLWAVVAGVLNYIPYLGAVVTIGVIGLAALVSTDNPNTPLLAAGGFFVINLIEANLVTPYVLGERLPLNPVAIFVGLLFWGWIWGVTGAVLAVPLTVMIKVIADRVPRLKPLGVMLDS